MTAVLLSAGKATRLDGLAPAGCKAMAVVGGKPMLDWVTDLLGEAPVVVCRSEHVDVIPEDVTKVVCDDGGGPARALSAALIACRPDEPVTVIFADTWLESVPDGPEWCAVAGAEGGRKWDVVEDGLVYYGDPGQVALVCVGAYRFAELDRLSLAVLDALSESFDNEVGMGDVVNRYGLPFVLVSGWQDIGDPLAHASWRPIS